MGKCGDNYGPSDASSKKARGVAFRSQKQSRRLRYAAAARSGLCHLWSYFSRTPPGRGVSDHTVKIDVHTSVYYGLARKHFRRRIPRPLLDDAILNRFCDQSSNLFTLQRDQPLLAIILVKLRTIIQSIGSSGRILQERESVCV